MFEHYSALMSLVHVLKFANPVHYPIRDLLRRLGLHVGTHNLYYRINNLNTLRKKSQPGDDLKPQATCALLRHAPWESHPKLEWLERYWISVVFPGLS